MKKSSASRARLRAIRHIKLTFNVPYNVAVRMYHRCPNYRRNDLRRLSGGHR